MTHISKKPIKKSIKEKISKQFSILVTDISKSAKSSSFTKEFFTYSEEIMFAKRLAIIFLIMEGFSPITIIDLLKVSPDTVRRIGKRLDRGGYSSLQKYFSDKKNKKDLWRLLETILHAGMPRIGRGRWKGLHQYLHK